jgi:hypothetical protein
MRNYTLDLDKVFPGVQALWRIRPQLFNRAPQSNLVSNDALHDEDFVMEDRHVDIEAERALWADMLQEIDFQKEQWYLWDAELECWNPISGERAIDLLRSYDLRDREQRKLVMRFFRFRSDNTNRIDHKGEEMGRPFDPERLRAMIAPAESEPKSHQDTQGLLPL